jgi:FkbM family methyltransferase
LSGVSHIFRRFAERLLRAAHPRSVSWRLRHSRGPVHPLITPLGWSGRLKVRIYSRDFVGRELYRYKVFEESEARLVTGFLKPGMIFFDLGANFGQYTILGADCVGASGQVHSFEPSSRMFSELSFNVRLNNLGGQCTLNHLAVSDSEGTARLSRYEAGAEVFGSIGQRERDGFEVLGYEEVPTCTLDAYIAQRAIQHVDLIKMDIEGAELLALRGAQRLLSRADAPAVVLEMADMNAIGFGYSAMDAWDLLESHGYRMFAFEPGRRLLPFQSGISVPLEAVRPVDFDVPQNLLAVKSRFDLWGIRNPS